MSPSFYRFLDPKYKRDEATSSPDTLIEGEGREEDADQETTSSDSSLVQVMMMMIRF